MKIATILPIAYLELEKDNDYHLCLAHLLKDRTYHKFFKSQAKSGKYLIMDNGVVETGLPMDIEKLFHLAQSVKASEMILPDLLFKTKSTLEMGLSALEYARGHVEGDLNFMAVPQGETKEEWAKCVREMIHWPVKCIGISRFVVPKLFQSRTEALRSVPELIASHKEIHLLGCPDDPREIAEANSAFPQRIRGTDSGVASIMAQEGIHMGTLPKPKVELGFYNEEMDLDILKYNIAQWKLRSQMGVLS